MLTNCTKCAWVRWGTRIRLSASSALVAVHNWQPLSITITNTTDMTFRRFFKFFKTPNFYCLDWNLLNFQCHTNHSHSKNNFFTSYQSCCNQFCCLMFVYYFRCLTPYHVNIFLQALKKDKKDKAGEFEKALWVAVDCLRERAKYFAQVIFTCI